MAARPAPARRPLRAVVGAVTLLATVGLALVACGGGGGLGQAAIAKASEGTWDCGSKGEEPTDQIVAGDGTFEIRPLEDGDGDPDDRQEGTWEVSGKTVSLNVDTADDKGVLEIRGFDDIDFEVATIEVRNPDDPDETAKLQVKVESDDQIRVDPADGADDEFPSLPWTCQRR